MQKQIIKTLCTLLPNVMVKLAYKKLTMPQVQKLRENELEVLATMEQPTIDFQGFKIQLYEWKGGKKSVLLIHGWEGQAGNFSDIINRLKAENYTIYAFDAPSHGFSSSGKTSFFEFCDIVAVLIKKYQVSNLISHSFGGVATTYALYQNLDIQIDKYLLLTTPNKFSERIQSVCDAVGITDKVRYKLITKIENEIDIDVNTLNVSDFVKEIKVDKAMIIHDKNDKVIPISQSEAIIENWKNGELVTIEGTGHFRILRTGFVLDKVIEFLKLT
jgi:pimeloyl-ACP methyl ester carboxylesterase